MSHHNFATISPINSFKRLHLSTTKSASQVVGNTLLAMLALIPLPVRINLSITYLKNGQWLMVVTMVSVLVLGYPNISASNLIGCFTEQETF